MVNGLGERLQKSRTILKLSQKEVANSLNVSPAVISNYEKGERTPSVEMLMALARLYHCSTDYLLGFEKDNSKSIDVSMLSDKQTALLQNFIDSLILLIEFFMYGGYHTKLNLISPLYLHIIF